MTRTIECKDRESWLAARRDLLTASDAAAALGLSPYKSPLALYVEKIGEAENVEENESMKWGSALQGGIGQRFADVSGREVLPAPPFTIYLHPDLPFVGATLDFREQDREKGEGVLEAKATSIEWDEEPPVHYQVQLQVQLAVIGLTYGTLVAFNGLHRPPAWADMTPNEKFIKRALGKLDEFRWRIVNRKPPEVVLGDEAAQATREALLSLYPRDAGAVVALPPEAMLWADELAKLKAAVKAANDQIAQRENAIKAAMGTAEVGLLADGTGYSWKTSDVSGYTVAPTTKRTLRRIKGRG